MVMVSAVGHPGIGATLLSRLAAACTAGMAATVAGARLSDASPQRYGAVLVVTVVASALLAAVGMWRSGTFEARLGGVVLSVLTVVGQVLVATLGGPASTDPHWYPAAFVVVALGSAVLVLVALDTHSRSRFEAPAHPYAR
jgi:hypothetical protein